MSRAAPHFRQADVQRAIKAAQAAGLSVTRVEIDPKTAKITVVVGEPETKEVKEVNPWDSAPMPSQIKCRTGGRTARAATKVDSDNSSNAKPPRKRWAFDVRFDQRTGKTYSRLTDGQGGVYPESEVSPEMFRAPDDLQT